MVGATSREGRDGGLRGSDEPLSRSYDVAMLDLDGVVYIGREPVPDVAEHLEAAQADGMALAYVTNNASRPPAAVAAHLQELGVPAAAEDVVTSAQAAARLLAERVEPGSMVFVIGGEGLVRALEERGLQHTQSLDDEPVAVVSGYGPDLRWRTVIDGAILVREGLPWVVSNTDLTVPTPRGPGPGNGVLVRAVAEYAQVEPVVAGKPEPPLFQETHRRVGGERPLVVGDRLDTDIDGARRAGFDSLLVMTGVTDLDTLVAAPTSLRPDYVAATLAALTEPQPVPSREDGAFTTGGWAARVEDGALQVRPVGDGRDGAGGTVHDWWRVVAAAGWDHLDTHGEPAGHADLAPPAVSHPDDAARRQ